MIRSWIGFILLVVLLLGCLLVTEAMVDIHDPVESKLLQAAQMATAGDWSQAEDLFQQAEGDWKKTAHFRGCFADHGPAEEVDAAFAMLQVTCAARDPVTFAGGCRSLARQVAAVGEAHEPVWWNLL
jgi:hypothetical protein